MRSCVCVTVPVLHGMVCNLRCVGALEGHEIEILPFFTQKTQCESRSLGLFCVSNYLMLP